MDVGNQALCGPYFGDTTIRYVMGGSAPVSGDLANIVFEATAEGTSDLTLSVQTCADVTGAELTCTATDGTITVVQPTPTPSLPPSPTTAPTAAPTATPAQPTRLPDTGGSPSDGSSGTIVWVLGTVGLAVLAAGIWTVSPMRL